MTRTLFLQCWAMLLLSVSSWAQDAQQPNLFGNVDPAQETTLGDQADDVWRYDREADEYRGYIEAVAIPNAAIYDQAGVFSVRIYHGLQANGRYCAIVWPTKAEHIDFKVEELAGARIEQIHRIPLENICLPDNATQNCGLAVFNSASKPGDQVTRPLAAIIPTTPNEALEDMRRYKNTHPSNQWGFAVDPVVIRTMKLRESETSGSNKVVGFRAYHGRDELGLRKTIFLPVTQAQGRSISGPAYWQNYKSDCPQNCERMMQLGIEAKYIVTLPAITEERR